MRRGCLIDVKALFDGEARNPVKSDARAGLFGVHTVNRAAVIDACASRRRS